MRSASRPPSRIAFARRPLLAGVVLLALLSSANASADVQACLSASEKGQRARSAGKLREAREHFLVCGADRCPSLVRHDCVQWNSELAQTLPTVVFGARDKQGRDLFDVAVSMDGEALVTKLDGKSITVDPGKHTFRFEAEGLPPISAVALIKEGERARVINVTFDGGGATSMKTPAPATGDDPDKSRRHTAYPWIVVGLGAVGIATGAVLVLTAPERPAGCNPDTETCTPIPGESDRAYQERRERAATADAQPVLGYAIAGGGLALVAGGLLWHFLEPSGSERSAARVRVLPWTTGLSSGLALGARF